MLLDGFFGAADWPRPACSGSRLRPARILALASRQCLVADLQCLDLRTDGPQIETAFAGPVYGIKIRAAPFTLVENRPRRPKHAVTLARMSPWPVMKTIERCGSFACSIH